MRPIHLLLLASLLLPGCAPGNSKAVTLTSDNFIAKVLNSNQPVLVDFWAEWCGPCKALDPTIRAVSEEMEGSAVIGKVNIDDYPDLAAQYQVSAIPTLLVFKNGQLVRRLQGGQSKQNLIDLLRALQ